VLNRDDIIRKLRDQTAYLSAEYGVSRLGIFGSFAKDQATENSDIDLVVEFRQPIGFKFVELAEYLEAVLGRRVELLTPAGIQNIRRPRVAQDITQTVLYV
jgi:uncharacterized protein